LRNFDRVAEIYDSTRALPEPVMAAAVDALEAELRGAGAVLDAGVGTGRFAAPLRDRGVEVVGLDLSRSMLRKAKGKGLANLVRGDVTAMPFAGRAFGSCLMVHVLHLVDDPLKLAVEAARVCRSHVLSLFEMSDHVTERDEYVRLGLESGCLLDETSEVTLAETAPPSVLKEVAVWASEKSSDEAIGLLADRLSSVTWDVPEAIHGEIIRALRASLGGRTIKSTRTLKLAVRDVEDIAWGALSSA
jgi:ubiquinone/menaquinone biosynthesis C-methylase UbiE